MPRDWKGPWSRRLQRKLSERGRRLAAARWAKWRATAHLRPAPEPRFTRWFPLEFALRDKTTGETVWLDFRSLRDTLRRLAAVHRFYVPGPPPGFTPFSSSGGSGLCRK